MAHDNAQLACEIPLDLMFQLDESGGCSAAENPTFHNIRTASCRRFLPSSIHNTFISQLAPAGSSAIQTFLDYWQTGKLDQRKIERGRRVQREGEGVGGRGRVRDDLISFLQQ